jgi:hypothetical protein
MLGKTDHKELERGDISWEENGDWAIGECGDYGRGWGQPLLSEGLLDVGDIGKSKNSPPPGYCQLWRQLLLTEVISNPVKEMDHNHIFSKIDSNLLKNE